MVMKELTLRNEGISGAREQRGFSHQNTVGAEAVTWLMRLFKKGRASLDAVFESDWEKKTGTHWREWGKYGD
jgi:predicted secreted protein